MNKTTFTEFTEDLHHEQTSPIAQSRETNEPHLVVQILSVIAFGVFGIVGISLAFAAFWVAGLALTIVIAGIWAGSRTFGGRRNWYNRSAMRSVNEVAPAVSTERSTGNASFDAYRTEMLQRLEQENRDFESFLTRLRAASDAKEFDQFLDDRAELAREINNDTV